MNRVLLADLKYLSYSEWISGDYIDFVKKSVLPTFNTVYSLKLRESRVLNTIAWADSEITGSDISEILRQDPATITRSLVILIGEGYVISEENLRDGRSRILVPTEKGKAASDYFLEIFTNAETLLRSRDTQIRSEEDHTLLTDSLDKVARRARLFRESQRELGSLLRQSMAPSTT